MGFGRKISGFVFGLAVLVSWPTFAQEEAPPPPDPGAAAPAESASPAEPAVDAFPEYDGSDEGPAEGDVVTPEEGEVAEPEVAEPEAALLATENGGTPADWQSLAAVQLANPQDFGTGSFRYGLGIDVPPFRGLEPSIALSYQSGQPLQYSGNGAGWMGIGWRLDGIPSIERGLRGGGSPSFNTPYSSPGGDVFLLAGEELVICEPEMVSPSCAAGGTHATRVESYRRISYSDITNYWTVTDRDGTTYEFRPTEETQAVNPSDPVAVALATEYRWLLRKVTDTHGNEVTYNYTCSDAAYCLIDTITYSGAEITFYWETRPDPYSYATGLNTITVTDRLKTIDVQFASNRVRTYALTYETSEVVDISRLVSVQQYPSDASVNGSGTVTQGATDPLPPTSFGYFAETNGFGTSTLVSSDVVTLGDFDGDGRTDYVTATLFGPENEHLIGNVHYADGRIQTLPGELSGTAAAAADFNGDGLDDLALDSTVRFAPDFVPVEFPVNAVGEQRIGDFNGDGRADIFSRYRDIVFLGNADETFTEISTGVSPLPVDSILLDANGDGKTDALTNTTSSSDTLLISTGTTYVAYALTGLQDDLQAIDIDGDGRQDLIRCRGSSGIDFRLSQGTSFSSITHVSVNATTCAVGDFNGDGRGDIAAEYSSVRILYSTGDSFVNEAGPSITGDPFGTADFNGDGLADLVTESGSNLYKLEANGVSGGAWPNLAAGIVGVLGGTTEVEYTPSSAWNGTAGTLMPFVMPTVTALTVGDGNGTEGTTTYTYRGGVAAAEERRFLGFAGLTATLPCEIGEAECPVVDVTFSQEFAAVGLPILIDQRDGTGNSLRTTENTVVANSTMVPYTALVTATDATSHDGDASRTQRVERVYDAYGQVTLQRELGAVDYIGDERATSTIRYPNSDTYIVNRPAEVAIYAGMNVNGILLSKSRILYDDATSYATPPTVGDPTGTQRWLNTTNTYVATEATYDSFGNVLSETNEVGDTTTYEYDVTYDLFRVSVTNALMQETTTTWNLTCARPDTVTDPNGLDTSSDYDAFCRPIRIDLPGGDYREFNYVSIGSPTDQYIETVRPAPAGEIWSREYADGLGRIYRTSSRGPSSDAIETRTTYTPRGAIASETRPFFDGDQAYGVLYTRDALDRVIRSVVAPISTEPPTVVFFTSGSSWTVPAAAQRPGVIFELIGGGGGGGGGGDGAEGGGGGGAYAQVTLDLTAVSTVYLSVGSGGITNSTTPGGDTWVNITTNAVPVSAVQGALAQGGRSTANTTGAAGGAAANSIGDFLRSGGTGGQGGAGFQRGGGGGGGAAGPDGNGADGGDVGSVRGGGGGGGANGGTDGGPPVGDTGGTGGNNILGAGGGAAGGGDGTDGGGGGGGTDGGGIGGAGSQQTIWTQTSDNAMAGPGAGAGGGAGGGCLGCSGGAAGNPGAYGGGGAAGGARGAFGSSYGPGSNGAPGIIVVTYGTGPAPTLLAVVTYEYLTIASGPGFDQVVVTDEIGRVTTTVHDVYGRTIETIEQAEAAYLTTSARWSLLDRLVGVEDAMGNLWSYTFDSLGRRIAADDPDLGEWTYEYDAAGRMTLRTDALGQETAFTYDDLGRVLTVTTRVGEVDEETTTNTYDEVRGGYYNIGLLTTAVNDTATITYDYDEAARLEKQTWTVVGLTGTKTEETGYHIGGQVLWKNWPDGTSTGSVGTPWTYDNTGLLYGIPDLITATEYNAVGQVVHIEYDNGVETDNTYDDARGWLMAVDTSLSSTTLQSVTYTRDDAGRILTRVVDPFSESWTYTYDGLNRLLSAANASDGSTSRTFTYDDAGNMLTNSGVGTYTYPAAGQPRPHAVLTAGSETYTYDDVGNMLTGAGRTLTYDGENRLVEVETSTATTTYAYGPDGSRIKTVVTPTAGPVETSFILGTTEITPAGTYIKVPNPDVRIVGATVCFVHRDQLASILFETDDTGAIALRQRYQPFGERVDLAGGDCAPESRGFIGQRLDTGTGLLDLNARWYDPIIGRFINADWWDPINEQAAAYGAPIGVLASPVGTNRYAYAGNDPINNADSNGHAKEKINPPGVQTQAGPESSIKKVKTPTSGAGLPAELSSDVALFEGSEARNATTGEVAANKAIVAAIPQIVVAGIKLWKWLTGGAVAGTGVALTADTPQEDNGPPVTLYRAVSAAELADILATGEYRPGGASVEGKYFALTLPQAVAYLETPIMEAIAIVSSQVSQRTFQQLEHIPMDRQPAIFAPFDMLPAVNADARRYGGIIQIR